MICHIKIRETNVKNPNPRGVISTRILALYSLYTHNFPTRMCLRRRGVLLDTYVCALCELKEEFCQHLFLECKVASRVWDLCLRWIGILYVQHNDVRNHFESFMLTQGSNKQNQIWKGVWATIIRCLWNHRN